MADKRDSDGLTFKEAKAALYRAQGMNQSDAYRAAYNIKTATSKTINEKACRVFARPPVKARVNELLRQAKATDLDSIGKALDEMLRLLEKATESGNYNAAAQLMRQRLQVHGLLTQKVVVSDESRLSDEEIVRRLAGGDPEKERVLLEILGAPSSFEPRQLPALNGDTETRH